MQCVTWPFYVQINNEAGNMKTMHVTLLRRILLHSPYRIGIPVAGSRHSGLLLAVTAEKLQSNCRASSTKAVQVIN